MEYTGNPNKNREPKPEKQIEKVVTGEVIQKPKSIGRKFKDIFLGGDLKSSTQYVVADVVLPAIRDMLWDTIANGSKRMIYGESMFRRRTMENRPTVSYNNPIYRGPVRDPRERGYAYGNLTGPTPHAYRQQKQEPDNIVLAQREDAEVVVERLIDIIEKYEVASRADLYDLLGWPTSPVDNKWGWTYLNNIEIRQTRDGYTIELPPMEAV